jgi:hypothetical protein
MAAFHFGSSHRRPQGNYARNLGRIPTPPRFALGPPVSPHLIFSNYREIVTAEETERYWQIFPSGRERGVDGAGFLSLKFS